jgi:hypothetical protein
MKNHTKITLEKTFKYSYNRSGGKIYGRYDFGYSNITGDGFLKNIH